MKIVVVGGSGLIGSKVVEMLARDGHDVLAASPRSAHGNAVRVPSVLIHPIAADDVARMVARIATGRPLNAIVEIGGPERFYLDGLVQRVLGARHDPRDVIADRHARYFGAELDERSLVPGDEAELGELRFEDWLARQPMLAPTIDPASGPAVTRRPPLEEHEFRVSEVPPGSVLLVGDLAVFNVEGGF